MIVSIYKEEVDNLDKKSIVNNFIKNGDVKLENIFFLITQFSYKSHFSAMHI